MDQLYCMFALFSIEPSLDSIACFFHPQMKFMTFYRSKLFPTDRLRNMMRTMKKEFIALVCTFEFSRRRRKTGNFIAHILCFPVTWFPFNNCRQTAENCVKNNCIKFFWYKTSISTLATTLTPHHVVSIIIYLGNFFHFPNRLRLRSK